MGWAPLHPCRSDLAGNSSRGAHKPPQLEAGTADAAVCLFGGWGEGEAALRSRREGISPDSKAIPMKPALQGLHCSREGGEGQEQLGPALGAVGGTGLG